MISAYQSRLTALAISLAFLSVVGGCAKPVKICPTSGKLLVNGQPADGAYVVFHATNDPKRGQSPDTARTDADGAFAVNVKGPGEYAVTVFWPTVVIEQGETIEGADRMKGKYAKVDQPVTTATIQEGENTLPTIQLKYP